MKPTLWEKVARLFKLNSIAPKRPDPAVQIDKGPPGAVLYAEDVPLPPGQAELSLFTPDGEIIPNPSDDFLLELLVKMNWAEVWGDDGMVTYAWFLRNSSGRMVLNSVHGKPDLYFFRRDPYGAYFLYRDVDNSEYIVDNGSSTTETICHGLGGNPYQFPASGFVQSTEALEILHDFAHSEKRSSSVKWVPAPRLYS